MCFWMCPLLGYDPRMSFPMTVFRSSDRARSMPVRQARMTFWVRASMAHWLVLNLNSRKKRRLLDDQVHLVAQDIPLVGCVRIPGDDGEHFGQSNDADSWLLFSRGLSILTVGVSSF